MAALIKPGTSMSILSPRRTRPLRSSRAPERLALLRSVQAPALCVPQPGTTVGLDGIGDRLMDRLAYRKFSDGHESVVGNFSVNSSGVAGVRWFELRNVTSGPMTVFQESTYQPDSVWRWMGSAAMDADGNIAILF